MAGRPGFFGGARQTDTAERDPELVVGPGGLIGAVPVIRLGDPNSQRPNDGFNTPPGFDPVWGTLGAPPAHSGDDWLVRQDDTAAADGIAIEVDVFGNGFEVSGQIRTGQFDRLSDWINMQTGFIQVQNACHVHPGQSRNAAEQRKGTLWVRLNQVVLVAERTPAQQSRPGAPVVQKKKRTVSIVTPGYDLCGNIHVVAYGSISQFLESPDPHFLPITDVTVRGLADSTMIGRFPFAMVNREQLVTVLDETVAPDGDCGQGESDTDDDMPLHRRWGAA
jgi:hypothetical protein